MVYKPSLLQKKLDQLDTALETLKDLQKEYTLEKILEDTKAQWAVERGLQIACQMILDIGDHILSSHFNVRTETYEEIIEKLSTHKILPEKLSKKLKGLGGFRNVIVHEYDAIDYHLLYAYLKRALVDFADFEKGILVWMKKNK